MPRIRHKESVPDVMVEVPLNGRNHTLKSKKFGKKTLRRQVPGTRLFLSQMVDIPLKECKYTLESNRFGGKFSKSEKMLRKYENKKKG